MSEVSVSSEAWHKLGPLVEDSSTLSGSSKSPISIMTSSCLATTSGLADPASKCFFVRPSMMDEEDEPESGEMRELRSGGEI